MNCVWSYQLASGGHRVDVYKIETNEAPKLLRRAYVRKGCNSVINRNSLVNQFRKDYSSKFQQSLTVGSAEDIQDMRAHPDKYLLTVEYFRANGSMIRAGESEFENVSAN